MKKKLFVFYRFVFKVSKMVLIKKYECNRKIKELQCCILHRTDEHFFHVFKKEE